ncbi:Transcriptional repressor protein KorB [Paraburkholderia aspalathi]|uniref:ParB/RepB/Spo0J family partition protein n=1 Tax=Paraburkholderia aspalathi TaxID=1324617 RepID=UPI001B0E99C8|nr:ParB/RepB/Spo0J family partition protein [Paraburkholderia aspalathi]CAE6850862.1 Transcriptional repressor protein KorB [Paraburkholderia aspalathi]
MAKNKLDLTGLDNLAALTEGSETASNGQPLDLPIDDVIEDPDQPRKFFSEAAIESLAAQIRASKSKKIRSPISVKPKNADGKYIINHGARRYRSTIRAGMRTIPGFIDETHDDYDQVAENVQREDLAPLEIAMFIQKRLAKGDKKGDIAAKLGQGSSFVSEHLPLVDAPEFIQVLARDKSVGVRTLYDLVKAHAEFPDEAEAYVASTEEITRAGVAALVQSLKAPKAPAVPQTSTGLNGSEATPQINGDGQQAALDGAQAGANDSTDAKVPDAAENGVAALIGTANQPAATATQEAVKRLAIVIKDGERIATVMHSRKVEIIYKDTGEVAEIDLAAVEIVGTEVIHHENATSAS